ncbi:MAG: MBL fold metallo-hydrolase [Clostridia bacterium]|nr:MBL fold metallo-hydrolase [Clostridia bacterium]
MNYRLCTLYSGSTGNAAYLETPGARILIDAGKCTRTLLSSLKSIGVDVDTLDAIFITHEHTDHIASLEVLAKKHPIPVHILYKSALKYKDTQPEALCKCLCLYEKAPFTAQVGDVTITSFVTPHDSRASVGYRFEFSDGEHTVRIGYATDIGYITEEIRKGLTGCESVVLESNHDVEMLMNGPYPYDLKLRIRGKRGHLSNRDCADFAAELAGQGTTHFLLAHLSEENNYPDLDSDEKFSALAGYETTLRIAAPHAVTMLVGEADQPLPIPTRYELDTEEVPS